jgi:hypothetical protein
VAGPPRTIKCHPGTHWGTREGKEKGEVAALSKVIGGGWIASGKEVSMEHHKYILPHVKTFFWQVMSLTFSLQKIPKSTIYLAACF